MSYLPNSQQAPVVVPTMAEMLDVLKAAGEDTRLRVLLLLDEGELTVTDLTRVLGQSQPRVSRHLKILLDVGLIERHREGSWIFLRITRNTRASQAVAGVLALLDDTLPERLHDRARLDEIRQERNARAQQLFAKEAHNWNAIRSLHVDEAHVEAAISDLVGDAPFERLLDLGTGTGRILQLLSPFATEAIGIDTSAEMLSYARVQIDAPQFANCQTRLGDLFSLPQHTGSADLVVLHQVLHFLADPGRAVVAASQLLKPGGRMLIVDFAPHNVERVRDVEKHTRLGFSGPQMKRWLDAASVSLLKTVNLKPLDEDNQQKLTVSLWLAERHTVTALKPRSRSQT